jgi:hypothetical protein
MRRGAWPCAPSHRLSGCRLASFGLDGIHRRASRDWHGYARSDLRPILTWGRDTSAARPEPPATTSPRAKLTSSSDLVIGPDDLARMTNVPSCQPVSRWAYPTGCPADRTAQRPSRLRRCDGLRERACRQRQPPIAIERALYSATWPGRVGQFELYFRECFEQIPAYATGAAADQELELTAGRRSRRREKLSLPAHL